VIKGLFSPNIKNFTNFLLYLCNSFSRLSLEYGNCKLRFFLLQTLSKSNNDYVSLSFSPKFNAWIKSEESLSCTVTTFLLVFLMLILLVIILLFVSILTNTSVLGLPLLANNGILSVAATLSSESAPFIKPNFSKIIL